MKFEIYLQRLIFYFKFGRSMIHRKWLVILIKFKYLSLLINSNLEA